MASLTAAVPALQLSVSQLQTSNHALALIVAKVQTIAACVQQKQLHTLMTAEQLAKLKSSQAKLAAIRVQRLMSQAKSALSKLEADKKALETQVRRQSSEVAQEVQKLAEDAKTTSVQEQEQIDEDMAAAKAALAAVQHDIDGHTAQLQALSNPDAQAAAAPAADASGAGSMEDEFLALQHEHQALALEKELAAMEQQLAAAQERAKDLTATRVSTPQRKRGRASLDGDDASESLHELQRSIRRLQQRKSLLAAAPKQEEVKMEDVETQCASDVAVAEAQKVTADAALAAAQAEVAKKAAALAEVVKATAGGSARTAAAQGKVVAALVTAAGPKPATAAHLTQVVGNAQLFQQAMAELLKQRLIKYEAGTVSLATAH